MKVLSYLTIFKFIINKIKSLLFIKIEGFLLLLKIDTL